MTTTPVLGRPVDRADDGWLSQVPEARLGAVNLVVFGVVAGCHLFGVDVTTGLVATGLVLLAGCVVLPVRYAVCSAACAWAYLTGFVVHAGGRLSLHDGDLVRLGVLLVLGAVVALAVRPR